MPPKPPKRKSLPKPSPCSALDGNGGPKLEIINQIKITNGRGGGERQATPHPIVPGADGPLCGAGEGLRKVVAGGGRSLGDALPDIVGAAALRGEVRLARVLEVVGIDANTLFDRFHRRGSG